MHPAKHQLRDHAARECDFEIAKIGIQARRILRCLYQQLLDNDCKHDEHVLSNQGGGDEKPRKATDAKEMSLTMRHLLPEVKHEYHAYQEPKQAIALRNKANLSSKIMQLSQQLGQLMLNIV